MNPKMQSMKSSFRKSLVLALGALLVGTTAYAAYTPIALDTVHSKVGFTASTILFDVDGEFGKYVIEVDGDPSKPESVEVRAVVDVASIDTKNTKRDNHLRSADFFDAAKYPQITFTSTSVKSKGNELVIEGDLSMHGKTKRLTIPFKVARGKNGAGVDTTSYKGKVTIDRNDFGIGTDSIAAKISLEDEVDIKLLIVTFPEK